MLRKMGWSEGQTLGKNDGGIPEPVRNFFSEEIIISFNLFSFHNFKATSEMLEQ